MYLSKKAQITLLKADKAFIKVFSNYTNFVDIILPKKTIKLLDHIVINNYTIK